MERPLWDRIQEIYYSTLPMPRAERNAYLAGACNNNPVLVREVASLLHADDTNDGFLESPVFELGLRLISSSNRNRLNDYAVAPGESLIGTTVDGRYFVESELGQGGIGKVYLARDVTLHQRRVVLKVLLQASLDDPYVVTKFRQEVEALARIDHPNVVSVLGARELPDGKPYIVMQYVDGVTLRSQILLEGMDLERAALILKQIGAALEYVHQQRIFHRDLKPENILVQSLTGGTELVKVVDFGIAKVKDSVVAPSTANKVSVGTVSYMSPEQLRGGERITGASDIYSMGVIAFEMITGRRPFNPSSAPQLLEMHREGVRVNPIDLRPNLSKEARAILLRALSFDPSHRYQNAVEFGDQLSRALMECGTPAPVRARHSADAKTVQSAGGPNVPDQVVPKQTNRILTYIIAGLLIVVGSIGAAFYLQHQVPQRSVDQPTGEAEPGPPARSFTYSLTVQSMRGGKPYQAAYQSSGKDSFKTGDKFRLNISSPDPCFVYLFNEGQPSRSGPSFTMLYPTPSMNDGSATLGANQVVQTGWNTFTGEPGTENFWIVWSTVPVPELEGTKAEAFKHPYGGLTGDNLAETKRFLMTKRDEVKTRYQTNKDSHQTTVRGHGDLLVRMLEFQHR
jgi:eukaryotic-like serine/threonine-protein kinase